MKEKLLEAFQFVGAIGGAIGGAMSFWYARKNHQLDAERNRREEEAHQQQIKMAKISDIKQAFIGAVNTRPHSAQEVIIEEAQNLKRKYPNDVDLILSTLESVLMKELYGSRVTLLWVLLQLAKRNPNHWPTPGDWEKKRKTESLG